MGVSLLLACAGCVGGSLEGTWRPSLVALSVLLAVASAFTGFHFAGRAFRAPIRSQRTFWCSRRSWFSATALVFGLGVWLMHFVGMSAYEMPTPIAFDGPLTLLSAVIAVVASLVALLLMGKGAVTLPRRAGAVLALAGGIATMHFVGMAAMRLHGEASHSLPLVGLAALFGIASGMVTVGGLGRIRNGQTGSLGLRLVLATGFGGGIAAMHYTAVAAVRFRALTTPFVPPTGIGLDEVSGAIIAIVTLLLLVISSVREAEVSNLRVREELDALHAHSAQAILLLSDGQILSANPAACRFLGRSRDALIGTRSLELIDPRDHKLAMAGYAAVERGEDAGHWKGRFLDATGAVRWADCRLVRMTVAGSEVVLAIVQDMTEQRRMEEQLQLSERLAQMGALAAGVGHEINNPLAFIDSNLAWALEELPVLESALQESDRKRLRAALDALHDSREGIGHVAVIVRDLKTFTRRDDEAHGPVSLLPVLESAVSMARHELKHRATVVRDFAGAPAVEGNGVRLGQVFLNLLVNAGHALDKTAGGEIRLSVRETDAEVVVEVADNGCGIAPEVRERIFEPFFTTKAEGKGTGLGLAVCKRIVESLGGEISLESELGRGTTFRVRLRRAHFHAEDAAA